MGIILAVLNIWEKIPSSNTDNIRAKTTAPKRKKELLMLSQPQTL